jgi:hypothetical protein
MLFPPYSAILSHHHATGKVTNLPSMPRRSLSVDEFFINTNMMMNHHTVPKKAYRPAPHTYM